MYEIPDRSGNLTSVFFLKRLRWRCWFVSLAFLLLPGCAHVEQPQTIRLIPPITAEFQPASIEGSPGVRVILPHYTIYSTIDDHALLDRLGQLMESALDAYRSLAPDMPVSDRPMECYIFQTRAQWATYTRAHTGEDAAIYLRVNRGGYTINDKFVAYWIGDVGTCCVAAHEGWHQYVARNFKTRLPPFLEEGIACLFEQVEWVDGFPRFNLSRNPPRLVALQGAADNGDLYPLPKLVQMHAGQVVGQRSAKIEAFYAQSWAFARFLNEAENGRFRPAFHRMLADAGSGTLYLEKPFDPESTPLWDPAHAKPMLEHYLGTDLDEVERHFGSFVRRTVDGSKID